ncbi:MAG: hypothetical protein IPI77_18610 [Saprospiraceae bacterium]|nr:hypothetical protein [Saprospiraceae bacterium]
MTSLYSICLTILSCCLLTVCGCKSFSTTSVNEIQTNEVSTKKLSIVTKLKENAQLPIEERIALYHKLKEEKFELYDFGNETELTLYGYSFLWENSISEAIVVFRLVISEFPNSLTLMIVWGRHIFKQKIVLKHFNIMRNHCR